MVQFLHISGSQTTNPKRKEKTMNLLGTLFSTGKDVFQSLISQLNILPKPDANPENLPEQKNIDYTQFKEIFLTALKENNVLNENFTWQDEAGKNSGEISERKTEFEETLLNIINTILFKYIDTNKNGQIEEHEKEEFNNLLKKIYNEQDFLKEAEQTIDLKV